jgi:hypothetical protein
MRESIGKEDAEGRDVEGRCTVINEGRDREGRW